MIVEVIGEPDNIVHKASFRDACEFMKGMDFDVIAAAEMCGEVLTLRLREPGGNSTSTVAVPINRVKAILEKHIEVAIGLIPVEPEPWPEGFTEMADKPQTPKVGVGVMVERHDGLVLLGLRKGSHGAGEWSFPGGHLELGESPKDCARRELMEETGIYVKRFEEKGWSNDVMADEGLHYVTLFMKAAVPIGTVAKLNEPDKSSEWKWFSLDFLPSNIFGPTASILGK